MSGKCRLCRSIGSYDKACETDMCGDWRMGLFADYTQASDDSPMEWRKGIVIGRWAESGGISTWREEAFFPASFCPKCGREL